MASSIIRYALISVLNRWSKTYTWLQVQEAPLSCRCLGDVIDGIQQFAKILYG